MPEYRLTFGSQYSHEPHPALPNLVHPDGWFTIVADDENAARRLVIRLLDRAWSMLYSPEEVAAKPTDPGASWESLFPRGEMLRIVDPDMTTAVNLISTGGRERVAQDGDLLVTVWANGTGEYATREHARWGPPTRLTPAP